MSAYQQTHVWDHGRVARDGCRAVRKVRQAAWPSGGTVAGGLERAVAGREMVMVLGVRALALVLVLAEGEGEADEAASGSGHGTLTGLR